MLTKNDEITSAMPSMKDKTGSNIPSPPFLMMIYYIIFPSLNQVLRQGTDYALAARLPSSSIIFLLKLIVTRHYHRRADRDKELRERIERLLREFHGNRIRPVLVRVGGR